MPLEVDVLDSQAGSGISVADDLIMASGKVLKPRTVAHPDGATDIAYSQGIDLAAGKSIEGGNGVKLDDAAAGTHSTPFLVGHGKNNAGGTGQTTVPFYAGQFTLADDAAATILSGVGQTSYLIQLTISIASSTSAALIVNADMDPVPGGAVVASQGATVAVVTSALTGTDGTDGQFTISIQTGVVQVENRLGASVAIKYLIF